MCWIWINIVTCVTLIQHWFSALQPACNGSYRTSDALAKGSWCFTATELNTYRLVGLSIEGGDRKAALIFWTLESYLYQSYYSRTSRGQIFTRKLLLRLHVAMDLFAWHVAISEKSNHCKIEVFEWLCSAFTISLYRGYVQIETDSGEYMYWKRNKYKWMQTGTN